MLESRVVPTRISRTLTAATVPLLGTSAAVRSTAAAYARFKVQRLIEKHIFCTIPRGYFPEVANTARTTSCVAALWAS